ncbi:MAG: sugar transferase, partial [Patescibacteria group bacterium]
MDFFIKLKQLALLFGDGFVLYLSLFITLFFRYKEITEEIISLHFWPFTIIFASWLIIFYIGGLYELRSLKNDVEFNKKFWAVVAICGVLATIVFYFVPALLIAPKVNLFLFLAIFGLLGFLWRNLFNNLLGAGSPQNKILLIGYNQTAQELADYITGHPQLGYEIKFWMKEGLQDKELEHLAQVILANKINIVVVPAHIKKNSKAAKLIYKNLVLGIEVIDLACLYETVFRKIPLAELEEVWFLENITKRHRVYEIFKRPVEILLTVTFSIATLPLIILIATFIKIISSGPIIFSQQRTGKNDSEFTIYK